MHRLTLALGALLTLAAPARAQQVRVLASVSESTIGTEETVSYTVDIQGARSAETPQPPETEGLALAQSYPSRQSSMSIVNGAVTQSVGFTWIFRPVREGRARFGPVTVHVDGREYRSDPIEITVVPQSQRPARRPTANRFNPFAQPDPQPPAEASRPEARDIFIEVSPSTRSAVQNQQINVSYELFFREGIQLRQSRLTDSWDAEGFWREELDVDSRPIPQIVVRDGLRYNKITLKRAAVFPTRSGSLSIDPLKIESEAILPDRSGDPFARFFSLQSRFAPVELASPPLSLTISPLPAGAPPSFSGAVGSLRFTAQWDRTELAVGESLQLTIRVSGNGNIATLAPPSFSPPGAFERYDPQVSSSIDRSGPQLRGTKSFSWVLVARSNGTFQMPAIPFSWFDPSANRYVTEVSDPVQIVVTGSAAPATTALALSGGLPVDDIAGPMEASERWIPSAGTPLHGRMWTWLALLLPAVVVGLVRIWDRRARHLADNPAVARLRRSGPLARKHLREADRHLAAGDPRAYYEALEKAILGFVGNRLNVAEHGMTRDSLDRVLASKNVPQPTRAQTIDFLDACDRARFSPLVPSADVLKKDRDRAADLLVTLDDALRA